MNTDSSPRSSPIEPIRYQVCGVCKLNDAEGFCEECGSGMNLCCGCIKTHRKTPTTADHKTIPLNEVCSSHRQPLKLYCLLCNKDICHGCLLGGHSDHDVRDRSSLFATACKELSKKADNSNIRAGLLTARGSLQTLAGKVSCGLKYDNEVREKQKKELQIKLDEIEKQMAILARRRADVLKSLASIGDEEVEVEWTLQRLGATMTDIAAVTELIASENPAESFNYSPPYSFSEETEVIEAYQEIQRLGSLGERAQLNVQELEQNVVLARMRDSVPSDASLAAVAAVVTDHPFSKQISAMQSACSGASYGTMTSLKPVEGTDTMLKTGVPYHTRHCYITAMREYKSKSLEELRLEDYLVNRKTRLPTERRQAAVQNLESQFATLNCGQKQ